jgi:hypothetical protein
MAAAQKTAKAKKGFDELAAVLRTAPPAELNRLNADELKQLTRLIGESLELHEATIAEAEENVVHLAPRPLRGTVRKLLGTNR